MAIPSGSGTEVLRNGVWSTQSTDVTSFAFDTSSPTLGDETDTVPANNIITVIYINWCETAGDPEEFHMWADTGGGSIYLLDHQALAGYSTFVWNTKFVLHGGDYLKTVTAAAADVDVIYSYLHQNWS